MKKIIGFLLVLSLGIYLFYKYYHTTGKVNKFLEQYPDSILAQRIEYYLGMINYHRGKLDSAIFRFSRVINCYTTKHYTPAAMYNIAKCYEDLKKRDKAIEVYRQILKNFPDTYYGELARKRLEYIK